MDSATASDPLLAAVIWVGAGALALSVGLLAAILVLRLRLIARLAHERRFAALWLPVLAACADSVPDELPPLAAGDGAQFLSLWIHMQESLRGEAQRHLIALAARAGADRLAAGFLESGEPRKELIALVALGHLRLQSALPVAERLIGVDSPVISIAAAQALLRIDAARELGRVVAAAARRPDWPTAKVAAMLAEWAPEQAGSALSAAIDTQLAGRGAGEGLARLLRLLGAANNESVRPAVLRVLERGEPAEGVAAALDSLWHPEDARFARTGAAHPEWFVRVAAAKALARIGTEADRELLAGMLSDASWWVRYRTAQALARLPGMTPAELGRMRLSTGDRYAADILAQVISEQGAAP